MKWFVLAAHPDDAEIGPGGFMSKLARCGHEVYLVDLTRGEKSTNGTVEQRAKEAQLAAQIMGITSRFMHAFPDGEHGLRWRGGVSDIRTGPTFR